MLMSYRARARVTAVALTAAAIGGAVVTATPASAATLGTRAVSEASHHRGQPYVWGAAGPRRFDCSGLTLYVYKRLGRSLPHNAAMQYSSSQVRHISSRSKAPGDLVFLRNSIGRIYHVGIYAGHNNWWVAPHTGDHVKLQRIYTSHILVARVR
jgi:cell wall-associated NlpC family hydrolase